MKVVILFTLFVMSVNSESENKQPCSVGSFFQSECHQLMFSRSSKLENLNEEEKELVEWRIGHTITSVCTFHKKKYLDQYSHLFGKKCCDPLNLHSKPQKKYLRLISLDFAKRLNHKGIIPGKRLCDKCRKKINFTSSESTQHVAAPVDVTASQEGTAEEDDAFQLLSETLNTVNNVCSLLGVTPLNFQKCTQPAKKRQKICEKSEELKMAFQKKLLGAMVDFKDKELPTDSLKEDYENMLEKMKNIFVKVSSKETKRYLLSLAPSSWSDAQVALHFGVSRRLVKESRKDTPVTSRAGRPSLTPETVTTIEEFYQSPDISRQCPGLKDYVSVRNSNGEKIHKQKMLLLHNLKEVYAMFREAHPEIEAKFSKFASLRPKWCVLPGAPGTHVVCVCTTHQNIKLAISAVSKEISYTNVLSNMVCDLKHESCMLGECPMCSGVEGGKNFFESPLGDEIDVKYKQWVTTDRCHLVDIVEPYDQFVENLLAQIWTGRSHHFYAKEQSCFLKDLKEKLQPSECIVLCDFAENFSIVVQDAIQGFHWTNDQVNSFSPLFFKKITFTNLCRDNVNF